MIGNTNYGTLTFRGASLVSLNADDPVLAAFEPVAATDGSSFVFKIGDGIRTWSELPEIGGGGGGAYIEADGPTAPTGQADGTIWYNTAPAV